MIGLIVWIFLVLFATLVVKNYNNYCYYHKKWATEDSNYHQTQKMKYDTFIKTYHLIEDNLTVISSKNCNFYLTIFVKEDTYSVRKTYKLLFSYIDWLRLKLFFRPSEKTNFDKYQHKEVYIYLQKVCQDELQKANNMINKAHDEMKKHLEENK